MEAYQNEMKLTDAVERRLIRQEFADLSLGNTTQIDATIFRLLVVASVLVVALKLAMAIL